LAESYELSRFAPTLQAYAVSVVLGSKGISVTLIAGFRLAGFPVLIGDFVLSVDNRRSGLTKKAHLVSPNFAVSWTGNLFAATIVFGTLNEEFGGRKASKTQVESFLASYDPSELGALSIIVVGWVIDDGAYCFHWHSADPETVYFNEDLFFGSGADIIKQVANEGFFRRSDNHGVDAAIDDALTITTRLMSDEFVVANSELKDFGHAYEILYCEADEFKYLNDVTYLGFVYDFDSNGKIVNFHSFPKAYRYVSLADVSLVRMIDLASGRTQTNIIRPVWQIRHVTKDVSVEAIFRADREMKQKPHRMLAEYNCVFLILNAPDGERFPVQINIPALLNSNPNAPVRAHVVGDQEQITIERWFVERMYESIQVSRNKSKVQR
jgi:hypothetical protein